MMNIPFHLVSKKSIFRADGASKKSIFRADGTVRGGFHVAVVLLPLLLGTSHAGPLHRKKIRGGGKDDGGVVSDLIADNMQTTSPSPTFQCPDKTAIKIEVKTDEYPWETSWSVANKCNGDVEKSVPFYTYDEELFLYSTRWCLSETEAIWNFTIEDIGSGGEGDGLCCRYGDGYYNITVGGEVVGSGAEFTRSASHVFGSGCPPTVSPRPSFSPTETTAPTEDLCPDATAIELILKTDNYPGEISWTLVDDCTGEEEGALPSPEFPEYNQYLTVYTHKWCLPESVWSPCGRGRSKILARAALAMVSAAATAMDTISSRGRERLLGAAEITLAQTVTRLGWAVRRRQARGLPTRQPRARLPPRIRAPARIPSRLT